MDSKESIKARRSLCLISFWCVYSIVLGLSVFGVEQVFSQPVAGSCEDFNKVENVTNPTPTPVVPRPTPTPLPKDCPPGRQLTNAKDGTLICVPEICLSDPRYSLFISYIPGTGTYPMGNCKDACQLAPVYEMTIQRVTTKYGKNETRSLVSGQYPACLRQVAARCGNRWSTEYNTMGSGGLVERRAIFFDLYGARESYLTKGGIHIYKNTSYEWGYLPNSSETVIYHYKQQDTNNVMDIYYEDRDRVVQQELSYGTDECVVNKIGGYNGVSSMSVVLDSNCNPIPAPPYSCGLKGVVYHDNAWIIGALSPISLILDPRDKIGDAVSVVQFPLDINKKDKWYAWKASADTPLVVFDPKHQGKITDATQLFGNFTFGKSWKNGFEALATLDSNIDGKVSGEELKDLGLWFDRNQNGVSQPGEVEDIRAAGITALYVKPDSEVPPGTDVYVSHGFDRTVAGKTVSGAAVDWFVAEYQSRTEGLIKEQARAGKEVKPADMQVSPPTEVALPNPGKSDNSTKQPSFNGAWTWKTAESTVNGEVMPLGKGETAPMGLLTFVENNGKITGHSFVEIEKPKNSADIKSEVIMFSLSGTTTIGSDSTPKIAFVVKGENGLETKSTAELSADGRWLLGQSSMQIGHRHDGKPIIVDYLWKGERVLE